MTLLHYSAVCSIPAGASYGCSIAQDRHLMIKDIAKFLKVTGLTIYRWASGKKVPVFKVSGSWRLSRVDIETWIKR